MQEPIVETLRAATSMTNCLAWIDEYGRAFDSLRYESWSGPPGGGIVKASEQHLNYSIYDDTGQRRGVIRLALKVESPALFDSGILQITATLITGIAERDTGTIVPIFDDIPITFLFDHPITEVIEVFDGDVFALSYFQKLCKSIRRRFPLEDSPEKTKDTPVITSMEELRDALYAIEELEGTPEWWEQVTRLFDARRGFKFTQGALTEMLGKTDEKHVSRMLNAARRKIKAAHTTKTHQNTPKHTTKKR